MEAEAKAIEDVQKGDEEFYIIADPMQAVKPQATAPNDNIHLAILDIKRPQKAQNTTHVLWLMRQYWLLFGNHYRNICNFLNSRVFCTKVLFYFCFHLNCEILQII